MNSASRFRKFSIRVTKKRKQHHARACTHTHTHTRTHTHTHTHTHAHTHTHTRTHTHKGERLGKHILALPLSSLACSFSWGLSITLTFWVSGYTPPLVPVSPGVWRWLWFLLPNKLLRYVTSCWCLGVMLPSYSCWGNLKLEFLHFRVYKVSITLVN